jgi:flagellum-specific ATP synthase
VAESALEQQVQSRASRWAASLGRVAASLGPERGFVRQGSLTRMVGMALEATGCSAAVGSRCLIALSESNQVEAEIVGFSDERLYMMPVDQLHGIEPGA